MKLATKICIFYWSIHWGNTPEEATDQFNILRFDFSLEQEIVALAYTTADTNRIIFFTDFIRSCIVTHFLECRNILCLALLSQCLFPLAIL